MDKAAVEQPFEPFKIGYAKLELRVQYADRRTTLLRLRNKKNIQAKQFAY